MSSKKSSLPFLSDKLINLVASIETEGELKEKLKTLVEEYLQEVEKPKEKEEKRCIN